MKIGKPEGRGRDISVVPAIRSSALRPSHPGAGNTTFENLLRSKGRSRLSDRLPAPSAGELEKVIDWARQRLRDEDRAQVIPASAVNWGISCDHLAPPVIASKPAPANDRDGYGAGFKVIDFAADYGGNSEMPTLTRVAAEHVFSSGDVADHIAFLTRRIRSAHEARDEDLANQQAGKRAAIPDLPPVRYRWLDDEEARAKMAVMTPIPAHHAMTQISPRRGLARWLPVIGATLIAGVMICSVLLLVAHELVAILG